MQQICYQYALSGIRSKTASCLIYANKTNFSQSEHINCPPGTYDVAMIFMQKEKLLRPIWASTPENLSSEVCEQQRCRPACKYSESDQRLCYSLIRR